MKHLKTLFLLTIVLLFCIAPTYADNKLGITGPSQLPTDVQEYVPQGAINNNNLPLSQLIPGTATVYYFDTTNGYSSNGQNSEENGNPSQYGQNSNKAGNYYPLLVNSGTTWVILNNGATANGAIQVASGATLNIIVCPTGGAGQGGQGLGTYISSGNLGSTNTLIGIENNGTINIAGVKQESNNPNTSYLGIIIGNRSGLTNTQWNIRESNTTVNSSFNVYSAYTELRYAFVDSSTGVPTIQNDNVTVSDGVLQVSSPNNTNATAILASSTKLNVSHGIVLGESTAASNVALPLGTTNVTSSNSSFIGASGLTTTDLSGISDSLIVNLGSYDVAKDTSDNITGSTLTDCSATVVGNVSFGWGGQFDNFTFSQTSSTQTPTNPTLSIPNGATLTIPSTSDITLGDGTTLDNNGTITVDPPASTTPTV